MSNVNAYFKSSEKVKTVEAVFPLGNKIKTTSLSLAMGSRPLSLAFLSLNVVLVFPTA